MGDFVKDRTANDLLVQMNERFDAERLPEMIALQKEFEVFSSKHSLRQSFALLGIVPADPVERDGWYRYLDYFHKYKSDLPNVSGHQRMVEAIQSNLEAKKPLPMAIVCHSAAEDINLKVSQGKPFVFSSNVHLIISFPTTPRGQPWPRTKKSKK